MKQAEIPQTKNLLYNQQSVTPPTEQENIFTSYISEKELLSEIYKELIQNKTQKIQLKNGKKT